MKPELEQAILKDGLFATVHRMQCQKRAAMPQPEAGQDDPELPIEADEEFESDGGEQEAQGEASGEQL